jgi:hypothetical protein
VLPPRCDRPFTIACSFGGVSDPSKDRSTVVWDNRLRVRGV